MSPFHLQNTEKKTEQESKTLESATSEQTIKWQAVWSKWWTTPLMPAMSWFLCVCVGLTFQCHSSIFRKFIGVKEHRGLAIKRVLNIEHILVLEAFIVKVEIPRETKMEKPQDYHFFIFMRDGKLKAYALNYSYKRTSFLFCKGNCILDSHRVQWVAGGTEHEQCSSPEMALLTCSALQQRPGTHKYN